MKNFVKPLFVWMILPMTGLVLLATIPTNIERKVPLRPNVLVILADDLGYGDLQCYNANSQVKTPNLDQLSREGIRFTDAHTGSAVCSPTRYGLLTGRYAFRSPLKLSLIHI